MKFLLDPGHGGLSFCHYLTPGKQSPEVPPGIYEGVFNRDVCRILEGYDPSKFLNMIPGPIQVSLSNRVNFVNELCVHEPCTLVSVHANAFGNDWNDANGFTIFIANNASSNSLKLAQYTESSFKSIFKDRLRNRGIKRANFTIVKNTKCPAVLVECGFMTNKDDCKILRSEPNNFARAIFEACSVYERDLK